MNLKCRFGKLAEVLPRNRSQVFHEQTDFQ